MPTLINHLIINILSLQMLYINKEYPTYICIKFKTSQQLLLLFFTNINIHFIKFLKRDCSLISGYMITQGLIAILSVVFQPITHNMSIIRMVISDFFTVISIATFVYLNYITEIL